MFFFNVPHEKFLKVNFISPPKINMCNFCCQILFVKILFIIFNIFCQSMLPIEPISSLIQVLIQVSLITIKQEISYIFEFLQIFVNVSVDTINVYSI